MTGKNLSGGVLARKEFRQGIFSLIAAAMVLFAHLARATPDIVGATLSVARPHTLYSRTQENSPAFGLNLTFASALTNAADDRWHGTLLAIVPKDAPQPADTYYKCFNTTSHTSGVTQGSGNLTQATVRDLVNGLAQGAHDAWIVASPENDCVSEDNSQPFKLSAAFNLVNAGITLTSASVENGSRADGERSRVLFLLHTNQDPAAYNAFWNNTVLNPRPTLSLTGRAYNGSVRGHGWNYSQVTLTNIAGGESASFCVDSTSLNPAANAAIGQNNNFQLPINRVNYHELFETLPPGQYKLSIDGGYTSRSQDANGADGRRPYTCDGYQVTAWDTPFEASNLITIKHAMEALSCEVRPNGSNNAYAPSMVVLPGHVVQVNCHFRNNTSNAGPSWDNTRYAFAADSDLTCRSGPASGEAAYNDKWVNFTLTLPSSETEVDSSLYLQVNDSGCPSRYTRSPLFVLEGAFIMPTFRARYLRRLDSDPVTAGSVARWELGFNMAVDAATLTASDFSINSLGTSASGTIEDISCAGAVCVIAIKSKQYAVGKLRLDLRDDGTVFSAPVYNGVGGTVRKPLGGAGSGALQGEVYTVVRAICDTTIDPAQVFCDDFERSVSDATKPEHRPGKVGNGWEVFSGRTYCNAGPYHGQYGCAGIDSDTPPWNTRTAIRANPTRSLYTRWDAVEVRSPAIDLGGKTGAELRFWVRRGADYFSEDPDDWNWPLTVEYLDAAGQWLLLTTITPSYNADNHCQPERCVLSGKEYDVRIELPEEALHSGFRIRFRQLGGSGARRMSSNRAVGYDYWHIDNVVVRELAKAPFNHAFCDNFSGGLTRWSIANEGIPVNGAGLPIRQIGEAVILNTDITKGLPTPDAALFTRYGYVTATSISTDVSAQANGNVTFSLKCGSRDRASTDRSNPASYGNLSPGPYYNSLNGGGEGGNFEVQYYTNANTWETVTNPEHMLISPGSRCSAYGRGAVKNFTLPISGMNNVNKKKFRLRFKQRGGRGAVNDYDYWGIDDVCVNKTMKSVDLTMRDAIKGKQLVGGKQQLAEGVNTYEIRVLNNNPPGGDMFEGALRVEDILPAGMVYYGVTPQSVAAGWRCASSILGSREKVVCEWGGEFAPGTTAPSLFLEVWIPAGFHTIVKNEACVTGSVPDPNPNNNCGEWEPELDSIDEFVFTYGECKAGDALILARSGVPHAERKGCREVNWNEPGLVATEDRGGSVGYPESAGDNRQTGQQKFYLTSVRDRSAAPVELNPLSASRTVEFWAVCTQQGGKEAQLDGARLSCNTGISPVTSAVVSLSGGGKISFGPYAFSFRHADPSVALYVREQGKTDVRKYGRSYNVFSGSGAGQKFVVLPDHMDYRKAECAGTGKALGISAGGLSGDARPLFCRANEEFTLELAALTLGVGCNSVGGGGCADRGLPVKGFSAEFPLEWREISQGGAVDSDRPIRNAPTCESAQNDGKGVFTASCAWTNVGRLQLEAKQPSADYPNLYLFVPGVDLGDHRVLRSSAGKVGRFYPDHFQTKLMELSVMDCPLPDAAFGVSGCAVSAVAPDGKFVYSGQPFRVSVQPCALGDTPPGCARLFNYSGGKYADNVTLSAWEKAGEVGTENPNGALSPTNFPASAFQDGIAAEVVNGVNLESWPLTYTLNGGDPPPAPTNIYVRAQDSDATSRSGNKESAPLDPSPEAGVTVARGRLRLSNSFGAEKSALLMEGALQYFDGAGWSVSKTDRLTALNKDGREITLRDVAPVSLAGSLDLCVNCREAKPGGSCILAPDEADTNANAVNGIFQICLKTKGGKAGSVDVAARLDGKLDAADAGNDNACLSLLAANYGAGARWLRYPWGCGDPAAPAEDSDFGRDPSARATFGVPPRDRRRIHARELF
ncbi:MAG: DUF11 domain-containing protein [Zoogloeaceae bacterium]|jgi:hypothetical protein|nr:DUF11 domain-containing protein [Zoogloeaceae bacterium]